MLYTRPACTFLSLSWLLFVSLFSMPSHGAAQTRHETWKQVQTRPGRLVFKLKPDVADRFTQGQFPAGLEALLSRLEATEVKSLFPNTVKPDDLRRKKALPPYTQPVDLTSIYEVRYAAPIPPAQAVRIIRKAGPIFEYVQPRYVLEAQDGEPYEVSDTLAAEQWHLDTVRAYQAWHIEQGDSGVVVAIVDTEINWNHEDLRDNVAYNLADPINGQDDDGDGYVDNYHGWDFVGDHDSLPTPDNDPRAGPRMPSQHGTWVTGLASATTDNVTGVAGTGFRCRFMPLKAGPDTGPNSGAVTHYPEAIVYAADHGADIINGSIGGPIFNPLHQDAVRYATHNRGVLVVGAAGNIHEEGTLYPAGYEDVLSVTASDAQDQVQATNYGCSVDLTAPGIALSTDRYGGYRTAGFRPATSFASPVVSGAAALLKSAFPDYDPFQLREQLRVTADPIDDRNPDIAGLIGSGRLNMYRALTESSPSVRLLDYTYDQPAYRSGDTIRLTARFVNVLEPVNNLNIQLETESEWGRVLSAAHRVPVLEAGGQTNPGLTFTLVLEEDLEDDLSIRLTFQYEAEGYAAAQCIKLRVNPQYVDLATDSLHTSAVDNGKWGYVDANTQASDGQGFQYDEKQVLNEASVIIGQNPDQVMDNIFGDFDFVATAPIAAYDPGRLADQDVTARYDDSGTPGDRLHIEVTHRTYAFNVPHRRRNILHQLVIHNRGDIPRFNLFAGMYADFDVPGAPWDNTGSYDSETRMALVTGTEPDGPVVGIQLLEGANTEQDIHVSHYDFAFFSYAEADEFDAISNGLVDSELENADIVQFIAAGGLNIPAGDSVQVVFAVHAAENAEQLRAQARALQENRLWCGLTDDTEIFSQADTTADTYCPVSIELDAAHPYGNGYRWTDTSTTEARRAVRSSGRYGVEVTNLLHCRAADSIEVHFPYEDLVWSLSHDTLDAGDTLVAELRGGEDLPVFWDMGDGTAINGQATTHTYADSGTYYIDARLALPGCTITFTDTVYVSGPVGRIPARGQAESWRVFPNPAEDRIQVQPPAGVQAFRLTILHPTGQQLWRSEIYRGKPAAMALPDLPAGLYLLEFSEPGGTQTGMHRLIIR